MPRTVTWRMNQVAAGYYYSNECVASHSTIVIVGVVIGTKYHTKTNLEV